MKTQPTVAEVVAEAKRVIERSRRAREIARACPVPLEQCAGCGEIFEVRELVQNECAKCNAAYDVDGDPDAEHREAYFRNIAGGCV